MTKSIEQRILYEDNHLIVLNKLVGEIVQGDKTGDVPLTEKIKSFLKEKYHKPGNVFCGLIHRLDRPVSGIIVFAKTSKALARMNQLLQTRDVEKTYWAVVEGKVMDKEGHLIHYLKKNEKINKSFPVENKSKGGLRAELTYHTIRHLENYTLLEVSLLTGRHHQIRAQLSAMGHPIQGDVKYGAKRNNADLSISLHARTLAFTHPVSKERIQITAPAPSEGVWKYL